MEASSSGLDPLPPDSAGEGVAATPSFMADNEQFQNHVSVIKEAIKDEEKFRHCIAEIHAYLSTFDKGLRTMAVDMQNGGGPFGMLKMLMGRKG